jgi:glycosyltransferase involved in cell wall biosynthesis
MRLILIAIVFSPLRVSGAVQLRDLTFEFSKQGHELTVIVPTPDLDSAWKVEDWHGARLVRLRAPTGRDHGYMRRTLEEFLSPFVMMRHLRRSPLATATWDGVIWYAPSIFYGPIARSLKRRSRCRSYLIIRDIFPEWAVDLGLMRRGLAYLFFKVVERYQYSVADVIGVQSPGNLSYFLNRRLRQDQRVEVLHNWLIDGPKKACSICVARTALAGRRIFVYAGNMGVAQGIDILIDLATSLADRGDVGFLFVGRGSEADRLRAVAATRCLDNILFFDEIDADEIPGLYAQCDVGMVCLDPRHTTHSVPGKFVSYMRSGLPVLARVNPGNDLVDLIRREDVGRVAVDGSVPLLRMAAQSLMTQLDRGDDIGSRCRAVADRLFSPEVAVRQIVQAIKQ